MKKRLTSYTFDASEQTVTHADFSDITLEGIQMIINTTDQIIIYNFADTAKGGTLSTDTLTLEYDTTSMSDTDKLMILVEDGTTTQTIAGTVDLGATDNAVLDTIDAVLDTINAKLVTGTDIGDVTINNSTGAAAVNIQDGGNTITVDGTVSANATLSAETTKVIGTVRTASGGIASGSIASGAIASGAVASGAVASGAFASGSIATGAIVDMLADDAAFTPATSRIMPAGYFADEASTDSVTEGDIGAARMTLDRKVLVNPQPHTQGGLLVGNFTSGDGHTALTATAQVIKASAGQVYGWYIMNPNGVTIYVHIYNVAAASVTVGTTTALMNIAIPAGSAANIIGTQGITFDTAMSCAATTTGGGNTAPSTALEVMIFYY
jgi:hypothetical protein